MDGNIFSFHVRSSRRWCGKDEFLEHADVFGNCYGTARRVLRQAEQRGHDLLLDIDVQGAEQIKRKLPEAVSIFIMPPDRKVLEARLRKRSLDAEEVIQRRLVTASREIENYEKYDYILVNDRLDESIEALKAILLAERLKRSGIQGSAVDAENAGQGRRLPIEQCSGTVAADPGFVFDSRDNRRALK